MRWDLGLTGIALLIGMALAFGLIAQALGGRGVTHWMWLIGSATYFVAGLLVSEVWFGWATEEDLQPNYDGLSFDEVLMLAFIPAVVSVIVARRIVRRHRMPGGHLTG